MKFFPLNLCLNVPVKVHLSHHPYPHMVLINGSDCLEQLLGTIKILQNRLNMFNYTNFAAKVLDDYVVHLIAEVSQALLKKAIYWLLLVKESPDLFQ